MDFTKVNPILGYEMYTNKDRADINKRTAYGTELSFAGKNLSKLLGLSNKSDKNGNR